MSIQVQELTAEAFNAFGTFSNLLSIDAQPLADAGSIRFWSDIGGVVNLGPDCANQASMGICRVTWRELAIDVSEFHSKTAEGVLPIDGDVYLHVAPPTGDDVFPVEQAKAFRVPKGTMVVLKPGVWHHAPLATENGASVSCLIVLPQRAYANDCIVRELTSPVAIAKP